MGTIETFIIICVSMFLVGVVDAVAGGGGLISLPVYLMTGLPPRTAFGTNKVMAFMGSLTASWRYWKKGYFDKKSALYLSATMILGELAGTGLVYLVSEKFFSIFLSIALPLAAIFTIFSRKSFNYDRMSLEGCGKREKITLLALGFGIGLYGGTIGAAGATIGMLLLCGVLHFDVRAANGTLKFALGAGCTCGLLVYIINGNVDWLLAIPSVIFNMLGNYVGSGLAVKNGAKIIRPVALIVVLGYTAKTLISLL